MGTIQQGRQGYLGIAYHGNDNDIDTPTPTPVAYLPFNTFTLQGMHEVIPVRQAVGSRVADINSVDGKKHGEGDLGVDIDITNIGYPIKLFMGSEVLTTGTPNEHNFYVTVSGNTPKFATIIRNWGDTKVEQFNAVCANTFSINVTDALATATFGLMSRFPVAGSTQTPTTLSGTVMNFARYEVLLGADLATATAASPTPVEELTIEGTNNITMIHSSRSSNDTNSNDVRVFRTGNVEVTGSFKLFFDSETELENYRSHTKQALVVKFSQGSLESLIFRFAKISYREQPIDTGIDDYFALTCNFTAELDKTQIPNLFDIVLNNSKSDVY